jgi:hypothetical protein
MTSVGNNTGGGCITYSPSATTTTTHICTSSAIMGTFTTITTKSS